MILAFDVGNTNIVLGCIEEGKILLEARLETDAAKTDIDYAVTLKSLLEINKLDPKGFEGAIICSVVPSVDTALHGAVMHILGKEPVVVNINSKHNLTIDIDHPETLGNDLICGAAAALALYKPPIILFDLGTATTVSVIDENGHFVGGAITAGLRLSQKALFSNTAQLSEAPLEAPENVIGKNTADCISSGILIGCAAMMDGMIDRIERELGQAATVVTTGGYAPTVTKLCNREAICNKDLLLYGLWIIYRRHCPR